MPGNIVSIDLSEYSREDLLNIAENHLSDGNISRRLGFNPQYHRLVIPKTPFKPGTSERWPDRGAHITVAQHDTKKGINITEKTKNQAEQIEEDTIRVKLNLSDIVFLIGKEENDEAVGAVFYLAAKVHPDTCQEINDLCVQLGLPAHDSSFVRHVSLAGVAPSAETLSEFRSGFSNHICYEG